MWEKFTYEAKETIKLAHDEARNLRNDEVSPLHILLGILKIKKSVGYEVLKHLVVDIENLRSKVLESIPSGVSDNENLNFSNIAKQVLEESYRARNKEITTFDILLGLLTVTESGTKDILHDFDITFDSVNDAFFQIDVDHCSESLTLGQRYVHKQKYNKATFMGSFRSCAKNSIRRSILYARELGHKQVGVLHLLYGVLKGKNSEAVTAVKTMDIDLDKIIMDIGEKLNDPSLVGEFNKNGIFTECAVNALDWSPTSPTSEMRGTSLDILVGILMQNDKQVDELFNQLSINAMSLLEVDAMDSIKKLSYIFDNDLHYYFDEYSHHLKIALGFAYKEFKKQKYDLLLPEHLLLGLLQLPDSKISEYLKEKGITIDDINELLDNDEES